MGNDWWSVEEYKNFDSSFPLSGFWEGHEKKFFNMPTVPVVIGDNESGELLLIGGDDNEEKLGEISRKIIAYNPINGISKSHDGKVGLPKKKRYQMVAIPEGSQCLNVC